MCVDPNRDPKGSGQPKVSNLDAAILVDQQVSRLQVPMQHPPRVTEHDALCLFHEYIVNQAVQVQAEAPTGSEFLSLLRISEFFRFI